MTLNLQTLEYYEWDDIQKFICNELKIKEDDFRDYHNVVGGDYKDIWHVWVSLNYNSVANDSHQIAWFDMLFDSIDRCKDEYGDWIECLRPVFEKMQNEMKSDSFMVYYSW